MAEGREVSRLDCSICLSAFKVPKLLPCFHTFCLQCLDEYVIRNGQDGKFECPLCRACTFIPDGGVKSFQSNFYIQPGSSQCVDVVCDICGDRHVGTHYCMDCEEYFCERCTIYHMKMRISREHALLELNASSDDVGKYMQKVKKKYYCPSHKGDEVKMVCKDCDAMLCVVCKLTEHENHNTSSITKEAEERRASLVESIAGVKEDLNVLEKRKCTANVLASGIEKNLEQNISALDSRVEALIVDIRESADAIKQELIKKSTMVKDYYVQKAKDIQKKITEKQAVINHAQNVVDIGDDNQIIDTDLMSKLHVLVSAEECSIKHKDHLIFEVSNSKITTLLIGKTSETSYYVDANELGQLKFYPGTKEANALSLGAGRLCAAFTDSCKFFFHGIDTSQSSFTESLYSRGTCAGLACIGSNLLFTSTKDKAVYKLSENKNKSKFESFENCPHGIACRPCGSHDRCPEKELLICILETEKVLDFKASEGYVIVICCRNKERKIWKKTEMPGPACIATDEVYGNVCLGYPTAHKVTINSCSGIVLAEFFGTGCPGDIKQFCPVSVCFDRHGCIIVADFNNGIVIRLDRLGNFLQRLVQKKTPLSVVLGENMLYVGSWSDSITTYQLNPRK